MPEVENADVRLHYELSGKESGEALVLGNSLGSNLDMWDKVLPWFESRYHVIRFDTRGHGRSSVPSGPYTLEDLGRDALTLMDSLGLEIANFCGLSMGGMVAMWLGLHAHQRVRRLVMANTGARIGTREMWNERIATAETSGMAALADLMPARWFTAGYREEHKEEMKRIWEMVAATNPAGYARCCGVLRDTDLRGRVAHIPVPSLVIAGRHDPATPPSDGWALHQMLRGSTYVEFDASHLSAWECPEQFGAEVVTFLERAEVRNG